ncbi:hypothetical protein IWQ56_006860, partial [Coemansia nantahalensis]
RGAARHRLPQRVYKRAGVHRPDRAGARRRRDAQDPRPPAHGVHVCLPDRPVRAGGRSGGCGAALSGGVSVVGRAGRGRRGGAPGGGGAAPAVLARRNQRHAALRGQHSRLQRDARRVRGQRDGAGDAAAVPAAPGAGRVHGRHLHDQPGGGPGRGAGQGHPARCADVPHDDQVARGVLGPGGGGRVHAPHEPVRRAAHVADAQAAGDKGHGAARCGGVRQRGRAHGRRVQRGGAEQRCPADRDRRPEARRDGRDGPPVRDAAFVDPFGSLWSGRRHQRRHPRRRTPRGIL